MQNRNGLKDVCTPAVVYFYACFDKRSSRKSIEVYITMVVVNTGSDGLFLANAWL